MTNKIIPYGRQDIQEEDIAAVNEVLRSSHLTQGPEVEAFEQDFAQFVKAPHAIAVCNGTAALHLAALALGVAPGDRVLVVSNTFAASANCIRYAGGEVEFLDIDPKTLCIDLKDLTAKLEAKPNAYYKGLVAVDFAGYAIDFSKLKDVARKHGLWLIEDSCHALGAEFQKPGGAWSKTGSGEFADISVFSFHPVKHIATGEGGMLTTANSELADRLRRLRTHGITRDAERLKENHGGWYYEMQELGFNYRMPDILCALGRSQLRRIENNISARRRLAANYDLELANLSIQLPEVPPSVRHAYHLYVIRTERRRELYDYLKERGIFAQVHYIPVHLQPYYVERYGRALLPTTEKYYSHALSLPLYHSLSDDDQARVIATLKEFFR